MLLKSILVAAVAICGLTSAIETDSYKSSQKHYKTPLGVDYQGNIYSEKI
jgi:hypothetical protein